MQDWIPLLADWSNSGDGKYVIALGAYDIYVFLLHSYTHIFACWACFANL